MNQLQPQLFNWCGKDKYGHRVRGQQRALHAYLVHIDLQRQGITPLWVRKASKLRLKQARTKISNSDISAFMRQLATMVNAGIPIVQALTTLEHSQTKAPLVLMLHQMQQAVEHGKSLAHAFGTHPSVAHPLLVGLIQAGEQTGTLDIMLEHMATYYEKSEQLRAHVKKALFYPVTVIIIALLITIGLLVFIVPQFTSIFTSFGARLPLPTQMVITLSQLMIQYTWLFIIGIIMVIFGIRKAYRQSPSFAYHVDVMVLKLYIIGPILQKAELARLCRALAITFAAGMPIVNSLPTIAASAGNRAITKAILAIRDGLLTGQRMHSAMQQQAIFPALVTQMVAVGEESGTLELMLTKIATYYTVQVDTAVSYLSTLIEPIIMVVLGLLIGGLVISMYLPIFKLGGVISGNNA